MAKEKICLYCGATFTPKNPKGYFCKTSHRVAFYNRKKRRQRKQETKLWLEQQREKMSDSIEVLLDRQIAERREQEWQERIRKIMQQAEENERRLLEKCRDSEGVV